MFGLGKPRSKLGRFLDSKGISQTWLAKKSGVNRNTVNSLTSGKSDQLPNARTMQKIIKALKEIDPNVKSDKFWDL